MANLTHPHLSLLLATSNHHKKEEVASLLGNSFKLVTPDEIGYRGVAPLERGANYQENASVKAIYFGQETGLVSLGDDSGFEVEALEGRPGIFSARFAHTTDSQKQRKKILELLQVATQDPHLNRRARFVCCLALYHPLKKYLKNFFGEISGVVSTIEKGKGGFGYDPIFIPEGETRTFAEMTPEEKNKISHRAKAVQAFRASFLSFLEESG